jgi:hypothetical protein
VVQTILFGSKARGDSTPDSDIDVLVILNEEEGQTRSQILTIASRISLNYDVLLNPIIVSEDRYQRQKAPPLMNIKVHIYPSPKAYKLPRQATLPHHAPPTIASRPDTCSI